MSRVEEPTRFGLVTRLLFWIVRRVLGKVPRPYRILAHRPALLLGQARFERAFQKSTRTPAVVKLLAQLRTSSLVGCPH
jgi:hypothetical protein